jgi:DNA-binding NarL/FixJ family response regulator
MHAVSLSGKKIDRRTDYASQVFPASGKLRCKGKPSYASEQPAASPWFVLRIVQGSCMKKIRIHLIDDHAVVRAGIRMLIDYEADMQVVAEASNAAEGVRLAGEVSPDVVLVDIGLPGCSGIDAIAPLLEASPRSRILILSTYDNQTHLRLALAAGASGYVAKRAGPSELTAAIRNVASGRAYVNVSLGGREALKALAEKRPLPSGSLLGVLTAREKQVLTLVAAGHTNQEAAAELGLSVKTVETYRLRLSDKLGISNKVDLVRIALECGLIAPSNKTE